MDTTNINEYGMTLGNARKTVNYILLACITFWHEIAKKSVQNPELREYVYNLNNGINTDTITKWLESINVSNDSADAGSESANRKGEERAKGILSEASISNVMANIRNALNPDSEKFDQAMVNITKAYGSITNLTNKNDPHNRVVSSVSENDGTWDDWNYIVFKSDVDKLSLFNSDIKAATELVNNIKKFGRFKPCAKDDSFVKYGIVQGSALFIKELRARLSRIPEFLAMMQNGSIDFIPGTRHNPSRLEFKNGSYYHFCHAVLGDDSGSDPNFDGKLSNVFEFTQIFSQGDTFNISTKSQHSSGGAVEEIENVNKKEQQEQRTLGDVSVSNTMSSDADIDAVLNNAVSRYGSSVLFMAKALNTDSDVLSIDNNADIRTVALKLLEICTTVITTLLAGSKGSSGYCIAKGFFNGGKKFVFASKSKVNKTNGGLISFEGSIDGPGSKLLMLDVEPYFKKIALPNIKLHNDTVSTSEISAHFKNVFLYNDVVVKNYVGAYTVNSGFECEQRHASDIDIYNANSGTEDESSKLDDISSWINTGIVVIPINLFHKACRAIDNGRVKQELKYFITFICENDEPDNPGEMSFADHFVKYNIIADTDANSIADGLNDVALYNIVNHDAIDTSKTNKDFESAYAYLDSYVKNRLENYTYGELVGDDTNAFIKNLCESVDQYNLIETAKYFKQGMETGNVSTDAIAKLYEAFVGCNKEHDIYDTIDTSKIAKLGNIIANRKYAATDKGTTSKPASAPKPNNVDRKISLNNFSLDDDE